MAKFPTPFFILYTDFGNASPYQAQLHAALYTAGAAWPIIDLHADLACYQILPAAYLLAAYVERFPPGCVFVCVLDPGVGSRQRKPVAVKCRKRWFVGPDNGLFAVLAAQFAEVQAREIIWQPDTLSHSFHGRDVFAPVAAYIAQEDFSVLSDAVTSPSGFADAVPPDSRQIIYRDHYGNLFTGLRASQVNPAARFSYRRYELHYARTFSEVAPGQAFWYENSIGLVEFAVNQGSAADFFSAAIGDEFLYVK
jgi:S-adenosylmethionine hydrolase